MEKEGYEGDGSFVRGGADGKQDEKRTVRFRKQFAGLYKEFKGKIYLPRFCVKVKDGKRERLDYYKHLLSVVRLDNAPIKVARWNLDVQKAQEFFYQARLGEELQQVTSRETLLPETDDSVRSWLICNLGFDYLSQKHQRLIGDRYLEALFAKNPELKDNLALIRYVLLDKAREFVELETDRQTQAEFQRLFDSKQMGFYMDCVECRFELPRSVEIRVVKRLNRDNGDQLEKSLLEYEDVSRFNEYEKQVALFLDQHAEILWWYRNLVGKSCFVIDGYKRRRIFPDFVAATNTSLPIVHVVEAKGGHLACNPDTLYKESVAGYFEQLGQAVLWEDLAKDFAGHQFRFQVVDESKYPHGWKERLNEPLANGSAS